MNSPFLQSVFLFAVTLAGSLRPIEPFQAADVNQRTVSARRAGRRSVLAGAGRPFHISSSSILSRSPTAAGLKFSRSDHESSCDERNMPPSDTDGDSNAGRSDDTNDDGNDIEDTDDDDDTHSCDGMSLDQLEDQLLYIEAMEDRNKAQIDSFIDEQDQWDSMEEWEHQTLLSKPAILAAIQRIRLS